MQIFDVTLCVLDKFKYSGINYLEHIRTEVAANVFAFNPLILACFSFVFVRE